MVKQGFQQTDVGEIPDDWEVKRLSELASVERGKFSARPRNDPKFFGGAYPFIQTGDVKFGTVFGISHTQTLNDLGLGVSRLFPSDTLYLTIAANIGEVAISNEAMACPDSVVAIREKDATNLPWLYHSLVPQKTKLEGIASQNAQSNLNLEKLRPFLLATPPTRSEQKAIAEALSDVDGLIAGLEALIAKKRDLKAATMQQLLTGKTRLPGFGEGASTKQTEIGEIPEDWEPTPLGELGRWKGGGTPSMKNPLFWENGHIPWLSSGEIKRPKIDGSDMLITNKAVEGSATTVVPVGSIITVMRSGILRKFFPVSTNTVPVAINQDLKALLPDQEQNGKFIFHSLWHQNDSILSSCVKTGTTVESVEFHWLKAFRIALPQDPDEQEAIASVLDDQASEILCLSEELAKAKGLKQGMMQELLTGRSRLI